MAGKREKPEEIVSKLRQVEVLQGQGATIAEARRVQGIGPACRNELATLLLEVQRAPSSGRSDRPFSASIEGSKNPP